MMKAPVNKIIPFSNVDGPGNRCAIFFQSCPFSCLYCHNPETIQMCVSCGDCVKQCPVQALSWKDQAVVWNKEKCIDCDTCIHTCSHLSSPKISWMGVEELMEIIRKKKPFLRGITVSGGECMNHADFLLVLFQKVKSLGLSCLIDSNGYYDFEQYPELLSVCDGVMLDVKAVDPAFHKQICGVDNATVLKNLDFLLAAGKLEEVRTVILPNNEEQNCRTVDAVSSCLAGRSRYKLIRYRPFGVRAEGISVFGTQTVSEEEIKLYEKRCTANRSTAVVTV